MLRINLFQFRSWDQLSLEIPIGGITLIKGSSGSGKTTILQAITWCLYGNLRLVSPNFLENSKSKTKVVLEFPRNAEVIVINRQKNPNRLLFTYNGLSYEDKVAQTMINDIFGSYDIWLASCYIGQGCRNSFLTAPNAGKMELLNSIAFHDEDPAVFIDKIDATLSEQSIIYKERLNRFNELLAALNLKCSTIDMNRGLTEKDITEINTELETLGNYRKILVEKQNKRNIDLGILNNIQQQLKNIQNKIVIIPDPDDNLKYLHAKYFDTDINQPSSLSEIIPQIIHRDYLRNYINSLVIDVSMKDFLSYTITDYNDAAYLEKSICEMQNLCKSLNVAYNKDKIEEAKNYYSGLLSCQERLSIENKLAQIKSEYEKCLIENNKVLPELYLREIVSREISVPDYSIFNTNILKEVLSDKYQEKGKENEFLQSLLKSSDVLQCPHCSNSLRYQNFTLHKADTTPVNKDDILKQQNRILEINRDIEYINTQIQNKDRELSNAKANYEREVYLEQKRIDSLKEENRKIELEMQKRKSDKHYREENINRLSAEINLVEEKLAVLPKVKDNSSKLLSIKEIEEVKNIIRQLDTIKVIDTPTISSAYIQRCLVQQENFRKKALLEEEYKNLKILSRYADEKLTDLQLYESKINKYRNDVRLAFEEKVKNENIRQSLIAQESSIIIEPDCTQQIKEIDDRMTYSKGRLDYNVRVQEVLNFHKMVALERDKVIAMNEEIASLNILRQHAVDTECNVLQDIANNINASIEGVCTTLFDRDISINLSLFKTMKTTKNIKPMVNFGISYQGGNFDNINQLSGGEGDRASLALTLALSRLSSCPILMLDESLASLDMNMKEAAIKAIREHTNNTVLLIQHDGIEGIFDHVIDIDSYRGK